MRIVAISDLHMHKPQIPECDLLLVGGDICPDTFGPFFAMHAPEWQLQWFKDNWLSWAQKQAPRVLVTWGNHDFCGHLEPEGVYDNVTVVVDGLVDVDGLKIWLTPWSNQFMQWAWMKEPHDLKPIYDAIPEGIDVLVSHQPPYGYGDLYANFDTGKMEHIGSKELLATIDRVKPREVICGHLHGGYGTYAYDITSIRNVSVVDEEYQLVNPVTEFFL